LRFKSQDLRYRPPPHRNVRIGINAQDKGKNA
jgi:hypothetical protein